MQESKGKRINFHKGCEILQPLRNFATPAKFRKSPVAARTEEKAGRRQNMNNALKEKKKGGAIYIYIYIYIFQKKKVCIVLKKNWTLKIFFSFLQPLRNFATLAKFRKSPVAARTEEKAGRRQNMNNALKEKKKGGL